MEVKEAIEKRRSVRQYSDKDVSDEMINEVLDAARQAPSGHNSQPWKFKVIKDKDVKEKLRENHIFSQDFVYGAPALIVCCCDASIYGDGGEIDDANEIRAIRDLSIASGFLVLRATELGLGTCYIGWTDKEKIKEILNIPKNYIVLFVITLGYPAGEIKVNKKKELKEILI